MAEAPPEVLSLRMIYDEADQAVSAAGPVCQSTGRCCRFREWGHTLYLSKHEADFLLEGAPAFSGPIDDSFCPFQVDNLCMARDCRPLGCRVYFCDPQYQEKMQEIMERGISRLKALCDFESKVWDYGPLHRFLNDHLMGLQTTTERNS